MRYHVRSINIFIRRADALVSGPDAKTYFVEPYCQRMTMHEFLQALSSVHTDTNLAASTSVCDDSIPPAIKPCRFEANITSEVCYLQSQNGNMYTARSFEVGDNAKVADEAEETEFLPLRPDIPKDIDWATEALGTEFSRSFMLKDLI